MDFIQWWFTPKFPKKHIENVLSFHPVGFRNQIRNFYRTWFVHPIRRRLARTYLRVLQNFFGLTVIGITGSAGKTTTKEMLASILKQRGGTVYSYANIDPVYNIPTTIFRCKPTTKYLILEMGVEYPGEMDFYLWLAKPVVSIITNIFPTHTLYFGGISGVAKEKIKIANLLKSTGYLIVNSEIEGLIPTLKTGGKILKFGKNGSVKADNINFTPQLSTKYTLTTEKGKIDVQIPILGQQFVLDSLAAASAGLVLKISLETIKKGIEKFETSEHRMKPIYLKSGTLILDDTYNNNPAAAREALLLIDSIRDGRQIGMVFGDMLELGKLEKESHQQIGDLVSELNLDFVIGVGQATQSLIVEAKKKMGERAVWVENIDLAYHSLLPHLTPKTTVLIKGSRSVGLDKLVAILK